MVAQDGRRCARMTGRLPSQVSSSLAPPAVFSLFCFHPTVRDVLHPALRFA